MGKIELLLSKIAANRKSHFWLFLVVLVLLTLAMMLLYRPLCPGHDFFFHYRRLMALMDGLKISPFLIYLDYSAMAGYGYFAKAFYSDVILIPFAIIGNLTNAEFGYQSMIFTTTVLCGVFTYMFINRIYKNTFIASAGALLFTFCIYRILDVYHRAAVGEALSFTFIPLVFWGLYEIINGNYRKWYILAIGYSLVIFTHLISSVLMFLTMLIILIICYKPLIKEPKRIWSLVVAGLVTLLIVSYYLFPMLEQMLSNTFYYNGKNIMMKAGDMSLDYHWIIWGMFNGVIQPRQLFIPGTGLLLTCVIVLRLFVSSKSEKLRIADIGVLIGLFYIVLTMPFIPWSVFPFSLLDFIQMPWRLYEFSSFFFAVAGAYYLSLLIKSNKRGLIALCMLAAMLLVVMANDSRIYKEVRCYNSIEENVPQPANAYNMGGAEYLPVKVPSVDFIDKRGDLVLRGNDTIPVSDFARNGKYTRFNLTSDNARILELPLIYYKGYTATLNNQTIPVSESNNGLVEIRADRSGSVEVYYDGTVTQRIGWFLSVLSIIGLCIYIFVSARKQKQSLSEDESST